MHKLTHVYTNYKGVTQVYTPEELTLRECLDRTMDDIHFQYKVAIYDGELDKELGLDAMILLQERCTPGTDTWDSFMAQMHPEYWRRAYDIPTYGFIPGTEYPHKAPTQISVLSVDWATVDYLNMKTVDYRNKTKLKYKQPDLCISFTESKPDGVDLNNCIPISNGFTTIPTIVNNELFMPNGAKYLWEVTELFRPDVFVIDTTPIGGITDRIEFKDLDIRYGYRTGEKLLHTDWKIVFDDKNYLRENTVLLVINGVILFPHEYCKLNPYTIRFHPITLPLDVQMMVKYRTEGTLETVVTNSMSINEYMLEHIFTPECKDAFIITIPNSEMYIYKTFNHHLYARSSFQYQHKMPIPFLRNRTTRQLCNYHISNYSKADGLEHPTNRELYYFDTEFSGHPTGSDTFYCKRNHPFRDVVDGEYEVFYFTTSINK